MKSKVKPALVSVLLILTLLLLAFNAAGQTTFTWNNYTTNTTYSPWTATSYTCTLVNSGFTDHAMATVTNTGGTGKFQAGYPKYNSGASDPLDGSCATPINPGLIVAVNWSGTAGNYVLVTLDFDAGVNGVCGPVSFSMYDINDDGSDSWDDAVDVTALDKNSAALTVTKSVDCNGLGGGNGTTVTFEALGNSGAGNCTCWPNNTVTIGTASTIIKTVKIKYYSTTTPSAAQYIIINNITTGGFGCAGVILPIDLQSFSGKCKGSVKDFNWICNTETDNHFFTLGHSKNGTDYTELTRINGTGNSSYITTYNYSLENEQSDYKYYRLSQTDLNGLSHILKTIYLDCNSPLEKLELYPNPAQDAVNLKFLSDESSSLHISVCDALGRCVKEENLEAGLGANSVALDISSLSAGLYVLKITDISNPSRVMVQKFVKGIMR
ncbi:MAG: T9SS type A sorting domain-containing protein [Bacteroidia bacterium]